MNEGNVISATVSNMGTECVREKETKSGLNKTLESCVV